VGRDCREAKGNRDVRTKELNKNVQLPRLQEYKSITI
jgi:hypothetical protein